jgi:hypothetical protein
MQAYLRLGGRAVGRGLCLLASMSIAALILAGSTAIAQTSTATIKTISGSVVDDSGNPVAGATVYYYNSPATVSDKAGHTRIVGPVVRSSGTAGKDGTFSLTGLPAGAYWLFAQGVQPTQLRSCDWGSLSTMVNLTTSSATGVKLQVTNGVTLTFQVTDARSQIVDFPATGVPSATANFRIFVVDSSRLMVAQPASAAGTAHEYTIAVPKTRSLRLLLDTKLSVLNQAGTAVTSGKLDDTIAISGQPVNYNLTVQ